MGRATKKAVQPAAPYIPTQREQLAIDRVKERRARAAPPPKFNIEATATKVVSVSADHADGQVCYALLADALATGDTGLATGLLAQMADASRSGKMPTKPELDFMLSVVRGIGPIDETEALLAVQMVAVHNATMVAARRLNHVETIPQQDSASNILRQDTRPAKPNPKS